MRVVEEAMLADEGTGEWVIARTRGFQVEGQARGEGA